VDFVEFVLGEPPLRQLLDLQVGKADVAEIAPDLVRKARQEGLRIWSSAPQTLVAQGRHAAGGPALTNPDLLLSGGK